jgi:hypothetical protein
MILNREYRVRYYFRGSNGNSSRITSGSRIRPTTIQFRNATLAVIAKIISSLIPMRLANTRANRVPTAAKTMPPGKWRPSFPGSFSRNTGRAAQACASLQSNVCSFVGTKAVFVVRGRPFFAQVIGPEDNAFRQFIEVRRPVGAIRSGTVS